MQASSRIHLPQVNDAPTYQMMMHIGFIQWFEDSSFSSHDDPFCTSTMISTFGLSLV